MSYFELFFIVIDNRVFPKLSKFRNVANKGLQGEEQNKFSQKKKKVFSGD